MNGLFLNHIPRSGAQQWPKAGRYVLALVLLAGLAAAVPAAASPSEFPVADFNAPQASSDWILFTDKWNKGDSTIVLNVVKLGDQHALAVRSKLGSKTPYPFAGARRFFAPGGVPVDMRAYKGVRLRVRGDGEFKLQILTAAVADFNEYTAEVPVAKNWRTIELPFSQFAQSPYWGKQVKWDPSALRGVVLLFDGLPDAPEAAVQISGITLYK